MTAIAQRLYIRRKLQEIIHYTESSNLEDKQDLAIYIECVLFCLDKTMQPVQIRLAKKNMV